MLPMTLTKSDIVERICGEIGLSKKQSIETVKPLLELIKSNLASGDDVLVSGFGKFCVKDKEGGNLQVLSLVERKNKRGMDI